VRTTKPTKRVGAHSQGRAPWTTKKRSKKTRTDYPDNWDDVKRRVKLRDRHACCKCGITAEGARARGINLEVDHIIRLADGGTNALINLQTLCSNCHKNRLNHRHLRIR
jgi:5-methylcytosine-specific restriction endonuclease McrA